MKCERESMQLNTELVAIKPIPISPWCGANGDDVTKVQPISIFDWKEGIIYESKESFCGSIVSVPSQDEIIDEDQSYQRYEFDTPLDYRVDWTTQMKMIQNQSPFQENKDVEMEETFVSFGDDDVSILDMSEETFEREEMTSLATWMKANKDSDIWVI